MERVPFRLFIFQSSRIIDRIPPQTHLCKNYENGYCMYGHLCIFAHGESELRSRDQNRLILSRAIAQCSSTAIRNSVKSVDKKNTSWRDGSHKHVAEWDGETKTQRHGKDNASKPKNRGVRRRGKRGGKRREEFVNGGGKCKNNASKQRGQSNSARVTYRTSRSRSVKKTPLEWAASDYEWSLSSSSIWRGIGTPTARV